jgi:putative adhesin
MKRNLNTTTPFVIALAVTILCWMGTVLGQKAKPSGNNDFPESDELQRSYQLVPGARVDVSAISGSIVIETSDTNMAEVHVVRTARSRAELAYRNVIVEQQGSGLVVRGEAEREDSVPHGVQVKHRILLKIPRQVSLSVNNISGSATIGNIDGPVRVENISGAAKFADVRGPLIVNLVSGPLTVGDVGDKAQLTHISGEVRVGRTVGHLELSDVSGEVTATIERLDRRGVLIRKVSGTIDLRFTDEVNADVVASNIDGDVLLNLPDVAMQSRPVRTMLRARVGTGGWPISITDVSGTVKLSRAS